MDRGSFVKSSLTCVGVIAVSIALVVVLFSLYFRTLNYDTREMSPLGGAYLGAFEFVYGPMTRLVWPAFERLRVAGWGVEFLVATTAVTLQNLLVWFIGKAIIEKLGRWRREI